MLLQHVFLRLQKCADKAQDASEILSGNAYLVQAHAGGISLLGKYHFGASRLQFGLAVQSQECQEWSTCKV